jgi:hypothetical protein
MEIRLVNPSTIMLAGKKAKAVLNFEGTETAANNLNADLFINGKSMEGLKAHQINTPGEYERADILVSAYQTVIELENKHANVYEVNIDDVNVCYVYKDVTSIPDFVSQEMGFVNVLVMDISNTDLAKKIVNELEPQIIMPLGASEEELKKFISAVGLAGYDQEPKLKVEREDFLDEEMPTRVVFLSKSANGE